DDLRPRQARAFRAHLEACPGCRKELEALRAALGAFRTAAVAERVPDWTEGEWKALMVRAVAGGRQEREKKDGIGRPALWPRWAAASALGLVLGLAVLSVLFRTPGLGPERTAANAALPSAAAAGGQDVVSVTMVSQETGLQVVWFFDKTFNYEGVKK
ncbi:MAG TPA: zf-HC2 domain-containing protein, partial [Acidobacteriota bacterium]|nr:zf-HC2 domain-containing protein [Acidobacteriota bacterium]